MQKAIQKYITDNSIMEGTTNLGSQELIGIIKGIKTEDNKNLDSFIKEASVNNKSIIFTLNDFVKMKSKTLENIVANENSIQINNLAFEPAKDYFNWSGNKILSLTDLGKQQNEIVIPSYATEIESSVFANNNVIEYVDMSLTKIKEISQGWSLGLGLFANCINLKIVKLPTTLTYIGMSSFENCTSLTQINFSSEVKKSSNSSISLPELTKIDTWAFKNCISLKSIDLPNSLIEIGSGAFLASGLLEITFPNSLTKVGQNAFQNCESLIYVKFEDKLNSKLTTIGEYAFSDCSKLSKFIIPNSIESIGKYAFKNSVLVNLYVSTQELKTKVETFKLINVPNVNITIGDPSIPDSIL
ncbi:MAG: leucine-rich repeat domain-containing protein, partial [Ureaplasma sp.]|nr:leucine-rich repeat domain-containing protein [Ureaplasma sp.]